jgi:hypothetical protein
LLQRPVVQIETVDIYIDACQATLQKLPIDMPDFACMIIEETPPAPW